MAEIVKACDASLPSRPLVAVKRILPHLCDDMQYRTMFLDESRVLAQLDHPNIIHAFEIGEVEGTPYIALDYVEGQDTRALFHRARSAERRVPIAIACHIIASVCDGLHHAHEQRNQAGELLGLVHRDVSLQNVLVSYAGDVKITDFGIAVSSENEAHTEVGIVKGKFGYMSPEQIRGAPLDRRSDVFGAGICLYELLTGEPLFVGDNDYKAIERVRNVDFEPPSNLNRTIPSDLERIVLTALAKQPRDRYPNALAMRRDLLAFMAGAGERCTRDDLGVYLRSAFPEEYESPDEGATDVSASPELATARAAVAPAANPVAIALGGEAVFDGMPGPAPFDPLDPVGLGLVDPEVTSHTRLPAAAIPSLRAAHSGTLPPPGLRPEASPPQSFRRAPVVPPIVPSPESIPGSMQAGDLLGNQGDAVPEPRALAMEWDEHESTTIIKGFEGVPPATAPFVLDDEVTRVRYDAPLPGVAAVLDSANLPPIFNPQLPHSREVTERTPATYRVSLPASARPPLDPNLLVRVVGGVVGLLVVLAAALYWARDRGAATMHLTTDPRDVVVRVNGVRVATSASPFVLSNLDTTQAHTIAVDKPGYQGWSTRLKLGPDQVLHLPVIRLDPEPQPTAAGRAPPRPAPSIPAPQPTAAVAPVAEAPISEWPAAVTSAKAERAQGSGPAPRKPRANEPSATTPATPEPVATSGGSGTLRINTKPWSRVTVDGRVIGNTPQLAILLPAGTHTVNLVNPEFDIDKTLTVEVKAGEVVTRVLSLP